MYIITKDSIAARSGLLSRSVTKVRVSDIRGMSLKQGFFGGIFGYGDVAIGTAATGSAEIIMRTIPNPVEIVAELDALRS